MILYAVGIDLYRQFYFNQNYFNILKLYILLSYKQKYICVGDENGSAYFSLPLRIYKCIHYQIYGISKYQKYLNVLSLQDLILENGCNSFEK